MAKVYKNLLTLIFCIAAIFIFPGSLGLEHTVSANPKNGAAGETEELFSLMEKCRFTEISAKLKNKPSLMNARNRNGETLLNAGAKAGIKDFCQLLIFKGADVRIPDVNGLTPLHGAVLSGDVYIAEILLKNRADINAVTVKGMTPLHFAAMRGDEKMLKLLMAKGAKLLVRDYSYGYTALHMASRSGSVSAVEYLIKAGINIEEPDNDGWTPLHCAAAARKKDVCRVLLSKGANINAVGKGGEFPVHEAVAGGDADTLILLLDSGADINSRDKDGRTPLDWAEEHPHLQGTLMARGAKKGEDFKRGIWQDFKNFLWNK